MLRKSTMLALTAIAALGLATTNASAKPGPGFGSRGPVMSRSSAYRPIAFHSGIKVVPNNPIKVIPVYPKNPPTIHLPPDWHTHHHPHFWYPPVVVGGPTYIASRPVAVGPGPCTCLSKEYTPEGAVLFRDRCTNEMAMNPPPAPQQTGEVEVPQQTAQYQQQYVQPQPQPQAK